VCVCVGGRRSAENRKCSKSTAKMKGIVIRPYKSVEKADVVNNKTCQYAHQRF
jgi:hypothetical protein